MEEDKIEKVYAEVSSALKSISKKRRRTKFFHKAMWFLTGTFFVLALVHACSQFFPDKYPLLSSLFNKFQPTVENPYAAAYPYIGVFVLLYPSMFLFSHLFKKYKLSETETILEMVKKLFPNTEFSQSGQLAITTVKQSSLFSWLKETSETYTYGKMREKIGNTEINIADIGVIEENISNRLVMLLANIPGLNLMVIIYQYVLKNIFTNKSADNVYFTFRGLYAWAKFPKKMKGRTVVLSNTIKDKTDRFSSFNFKDEESILLEDQRFSKDFVAYGTDQIEARYILSLSLMEKISTLKEKFNRPMMLSFVKGNVYIAVENPHGIFSFPSGKIDSIQVVQELYHEIDTAFQIVTDFNLNKDNFGI